MWLFFGKRTVKDYGFGEAFCDWHLTIYGRYVKMVAVKVGLSVIKELFYQNFSENIPENMKICFGGEKRKTSFDLNF